MLVLSRVEVLLMTKIQDVYYFTIVLFTFFIHMFNVLVGCNATWNNVRDSYFNINLFLDTVCLSYNPVFFLIVLMFLLLQLCFTLDLAQYLKSEWVNK